MVLGVFACARPADAGWLDIIWEMTGPRMIGIGGECERSLKRDGEWRCILPLIGQPRPAAAHQPTTVLGVRRVVLLLFDGRQRIQGRTVSGASV